MIEPKERVFLNSLLGDRKTILLVAEANQLRRFFYGEPSCQHGELQKGR